MNRLKLLLCVCYNGLDCRRLRIMPSSQRLRIMPSQRLQSKGTCRYAMEAPHTPHPTARLNYMYNKPAQCMSTPQSKYPRQSMCFALTTAVAFPLALPLPPFGATGSDGKSSVSSLGAA